MDITSAHRRAYVLLRPVLAEIFAKQVESEESNPFLGQISLEGMHLRRVQPGRVEMLDELLPEVLDPAFMESETEEKPVVGTPFKKR